MADVRLTELLRVLDLAALREQRHMGVMLRAVVRQYRAVSVADVARQLREALDAPDTRSAKARTDLVLKALDIAVKELKLPPAQAERIVRGAVRGRVQSLDELIRLQNPQFSFNDPREMQARAVSVARRDMNTYWAKEQRRFRNDVARVIRQAIRTGLDASQAADLLQARLKVSRNRAVLIATDQLLTAAATADRLRQRDMGITEYVWRSQHDQKVRDRHRVLDRLGRRGVRRRWSGEPDGIYPGKEIRCRCRAVPVVPAALPRAA